METIKLPKFKAQGELFFPELKHKINYHFDKHGMAKTANIDACIKALIFVCASVKTYFFILQTGSYVGWAMLGFLYAGIGFNIMHDAGHGSWHKNNWVNDFLVLSLNLVGANAFLWIFKHNWLHHRFTNLDGIDEDIHIPFMRVHRSQKWKKYHVYQAYYALPLYMLTYFSWVWYADFKKYFSRKINGHDIGKASMNEHIIFWSSKFFYAFYIIAVPVYYLGWQEALIGYGILCATCGLFISIVFQLAHVVEGVDNPIVVEGNVIKEEWARHEIQTTANFATHNRLVNWYCGGLNFQIEHHLFPGINHIHYSRMSPVVKEMCKKFGIVYNEKPTIAIALKSHFNYLKSIGAKP